MIARGDIVTITGQAGHWAVAEPCTAGIPPGRRWRCVRDIPNGPPASRIVGDGDVTVLTSPAFVPGQKLKYWGREVEVVEDRGDRVRVFADRRKLVARHTRYPGGVFIDVSGESEIERGQLVAENINQLLKENGNE